MIKEYQSDYSLSTDATLQLVTTSDGSCTLYNPLIGEHYHSRHGALNESLHVFVNSGLKYFLNTHNKKSGSILEVGFGTGLNFLLTANYCLENKVSLHYQGVEPFPLNAEFIAQLGYQQYISPQLWECFLHQYPHSFSGGVNLNSQLNLKIAGVPLLKLEPIQQQFDIVYYDAFSAIHQSEMWSYESLAHVCQFLKPNGIFVTYAITGNLKRILQSLGFSISKIPGPPGKREMLRAEKVIIV